MLIRELPADSVRVPEPNVGEALVISRYKTSKRKAVVIHPDDFLWLERLAEIYRKQRAKQRSSLSRLAAEAHRLDEAAEDEAEFDLSLIKNDSKS